MSALNDAAQAFSPDHALRHRMREGCRESLAHMLMFPELGIAGFLYPSVHSDGFAKGRVALFGPGVGNEPVQEQVEGQVPDSLNFDDWQHGPLRMAITRPHHTVELAWRGERIQFEGQFEAFHPPYAFSLADQGVPPYYGDDRTEQHGRLRGQLTLDGKSSEIDAFMIRDHSWGPRIWGLNQHYKWVHATTEDCSLHCFEMQSFGHRELRGYVYRDGVMEHVTGMDCDYRFDDQMMHQSFDASVTDSGGRRTEVRCQAFATLQVELDPVVYNNEAALSVDIDGRQGSGWCEFC